METEIKGNGNEALDARIEIDTRAPFQSVKEAVELFGEKILAGEIASKLNEIRATRNENEQSGSRLSLLVAELEETKQNLGKEQEERLEIALCLATLTQELEKTKIELNRLKARDLEKATTDTEIEDIKFIENAIEIERPIDEENIEIERKKHVKFANPPSLTQVMNSAEHVLQKEFSNGRENTEIRNKQKKKTILPMIASLFLKKKKSYKCEEIAQNHGMKTVE